MDAAAVAFAHGAAVDGEEIDAVFSKERQEFVEHGGVVKADAGFDGERNFNGVAECAEDGVDLGMLHLVGHMDEPRSLRVD